MQEQFKTEIDMRHNMYLSIVYLFIVYYEKKSNVVYAYTLCYS